jgi:hypothetical protein
METRREREAREYREKVEEQKRQKRLYRQARLVDDDIDRSPDSDPNDYERPTF